MRKIYSADTRKELPMEGSFKTDVTLDGDGEGGVFLSLSWNEMRNLGSVVARIAPENVEKFMEGFKKASEERDA